MLCMHLGVMSAVPINYELLYGIHPVWNVFMIWGLHSQLLLSHGYMAYIHVHVRTHACIYMYYTVYVYTRLGIHVQLCVYVFVGATDVYEVFIQC